MSQGFSQEAELIMYSKYGGFSSWDCRFTEVGKAREAKIQEATNDGVAIGCFPGVSQHLL